MQWVCSLRDSLQGLDELTLPIRPTNRLPTSPLGAGHKATGRLHCYFCNFSRVVQATLLCKSRIGLFQAPFRDFLRITTRPLLRNLPHLWKGAGFCGKLTQPARFARFGLFIFQQSAEIQRLCRRSKQKTNLRHRRGTGFPKSEKTSEFWRSGDSPGHISP